MLEYLQCCETIFIHQQERDSIDKVQITEFPSLNVIPQSFQ